MFKPSLELYPEVRYIQIRHRQTLLCTVTDLLVLGTGLRVKDEHSAFIT